MMFLGYAYSAKLLLFACSCASSDSALAFEIGERHVERFVTEPIFEWSAGPRVNFWVVDKPSATIAKPPAKVRLGIGSHGARLTAGDISTWSFPSHTTRK